MVRMTKEGHIKGMKDTFNRVFETVKAKNKAYTAGSSDPYANFRLAELDDVHPMRGVMLRTSDKLQRIRSFINAVDATEDLTAYLGKDGVGDDFEDVIGYMLILSGMAREEMGTTITSEDEVQPDDSA